MIKVYKEKQIIAELQKVLDKSFAGYYDGHGGSRETLESVIEVLKGHNLNEAKRKVRTKWTKHFKSGEKRMPL